MAVYTDVDDAELSEFLKSYGLGKLLAFRGIAEGVENSNYLVDTSDGRFILTLYEKRVDEKELPFFLGLLKHLADKGLPCPPPLHDLEGRTLRRLAGRPAALITFLEGIWPRRPSMTHCARVGEALARLHLAGADFKMTRANALSIEGWRTLRDALESDTDKVDDLHHDLMALVRLETDYLSANWPKDLPGGVIHADLFPDNVFFTDDTVSGVIDFYFACNDFLAYDVAICMNAWCFEHNREFNVTKARAFLRGYQSVRTLEAVELPVLPLLCRGAALRFLLTRLYDWVHTPKDAFVKPHDPLDYANRLRFFANTQSVADFGLD